MMLLRRLLERPSMGQAADRYTRHNMDRSRDDYGSRWFCSWLAAATFLAIATGLSTAAARASETCHLGEAHDLAAPVFGINIAGPAFAPERIGEHGKTFIYPPPEMLEYYRGKGFRVIRLTFLWERLQPRLFEAFDEEELRRLEDFLSAAGTRGMKAIIGPHNYARYRIDGEPQLIGTAAVPAEAFADLWRRLARHFRGNEAIFAYTLMNEPHDTGGLWKDTAQTGLDAIREADAERTVYVPGDEWSSALRWRDYNEELILDDPSDRLVYDAHLYFDRNSSGFYEEGYDAGAAQPDIGSQRVAPFLAWLREHGLRGVVTEYGVPNDDPRWLIVLERFLTTLRDAGVSGTYWAGGPWWGDYPLSAEPREGTDAPVMAVLSKFADPCASR
jgi:endoglucanase